MKRKVKRTLAFLLALTLMVSLMGKDRLFVAAESAAAETVSTEETEQGGSVHETVSVSEEQAQEEEMLTSDMAQEGVTEEQAQETTPVETQTETTAEASSEETSSAESTTTEESPTVESTQESEESDEEETTTQETDTEESEEVTEETSETDITGEKAEEAEEKPEFTYCETVDGVEVRIHAAEGILPKGTTVTIEPLDDHVIKNATQSINENLEEKEVVQIIGFDICFFDPDGNELHDLDGEVEIEYSGMDILDTAAEAQVYHADEDGNITHTLTEAAAPSEAVEFSSDQFSPVLYAVYETVQNEITAYAISESETVGVGETVTLKSGSAGCGYGSWSSSNESIATVDQNGVVTGVSVSETPVTITHTYCTKQRNHQYSWDREHNYNGEEKFSVTVTAAGALVYYLKSPTSDPDSNETDQWGNAVQYNGNNAEVNTTGATWTENKNIFKQNADLTQYIISWPDGSTGSTWTLDKNIYQETVYAAVYNTYRTELENTLGINNLEQSDIEEITLIPYKISMNNSSTPDKHIDCTISVKCSKAYVARFNVQNPGEIGYTNVSAQNKKIVNDVPETIVKYTDEINVPTRKEVDGITYVFDGWYGEDGEKIEENEWPYKPNEKELEDGTVNFYARYVRANVRITITKQVTGNMGDVNKEFSFSYSYGEDDNPQTGTFTLRNGGSHDLENVPIGTTLTLTETNAEGYTISAEYGNTTVSDGNGMTFTINNEDTVIVVKNHKEAIPDTGVLLDSLPYVLILMLTVISGVVLLHRKRRNGEFN